MRLFIVRSEEFIQQEGAFVTITEPRIVRHAHVIRLQEREYLAVQWGSQRYHGTLTSFHKNHLTISIDQREYAPERNSQGSIAMAVALPNTGQKLDLITEKLTEIGVDQIIFFAAERSQIRDLSPKKLEKLTLRALEASEQSTRWTVPVVQYLSTLEEVLALEGVCYLFDQGGRPCADISRDQYTIGLVGPEGGRSDSELVQMKSLPIIGLGETILRMETAAIIGGWVLCR